jgi:hypothetical protein
MKFLILGDGYIAKMHRKAIYKMGGDLVLSDPKKFVIERYEDIFRDVDYAVICSPTNYHWAQIQAALLLMPAHGQIIVEKPAWLPWEPFIDDDRINIVLQYRYAELPRVDRVSVCMVRDIDYLRSWKGDHLLTGGFMVNLFIHYLDIAYRNEAKFSGQVVMDGDNWRKADGRDLNEYDQDLLYLRMYEAIYRGDGIKPGQIREFWGWLSGVLAQIDYDDSSLLNASPIQFDFKNKGGGSGNAG